MLDVARSIKSDSLQTNSLIVTDHSDLHSVIASSLGVTGNVQVTGDVIARVLQADAIEATDGYSSIRNLNTYNGDILHLSNLQDISSFSSNPIAVNASLDITGAVDIADQVKVHSATTPIVADYNNPRTRSGFVYQSFARAGVPKWWLSSNVKTDNLVIKSASGRGSIFVTKDENVGLGTSRPKAKLQVVGKTMLDVLALVPRTSAPSGAAVGDIYSYKDGSKIALCMFSGAGWVTVGGTATCP